MGKYGVMYDIEFIKGFTSGKLRFRNYRLYKKFGSIFHYRSRLFGVVANLIAFPLCVQTWE